MVCPTEPGTNVCKANSAACVRKILPTFPADSWQIPQNIVIYLDISTRILDLATYGGIIILTPVWFERGEMSKRRHDPKLEALRAERSVNPRPEAVRDEAFSASTFFDPRDVVQVKYEMVRKARVGGATVKGAADAFGFSRPSFYEAAAALDGGGLPALVPNRPGPRRAHKLTEEIVGFALARLEDDPSMRSAELVEAIAARFGVAVHPRSVERALARAKEPKSRGER
jgi:transposase